MTTGSGWVGSITLVAFIGLFVLAGLMVPPLPSFASEVPRIEVEETRELVFSGKALLVCAYEGEDKFRSMPLEGAISLDGFSEYAEMVPASEKIVFY